MVCACSGACRIYGHCGCPKPPLYDGQPFPYTLPTIPPNVPTQWWWERYQFPAATNYGCICPPTSEQTCQAAICPRRAIKVTAGGTHEAVTPEAREGED